VIFKALLVENKPNKTPHFYVSAEQVTLGLHYKVPGSNPTSWGYSQRFLQPNVGTLPWNRL